MKLTVLLIILMISITAKAETPEKVTTIITALEKGNSSKRAEAVKKIDQLSSQEKETLKKLLEKSDDPEFIAVLKKFFPKTEKNESFDVVARKYVTAVFNSDLEALNTLSTTPFSMGEGNRAEILDKDQLKSIYEKIAKQNQRKKRNIVYVDSIPDKFVNLDKKVAVEYKVVRFLPQNAKRGEDGVDIYLKKINGKFLVVGLQEIEK